MQPLLTKSTQRSFIFASAHTNLICIDSFPSLHPSTNTNFARPGPLLYGYLIWNLGSGFGSGTFITRPSWAITLLALSKSTIVIHRTDNGFHSCSNSSTGVCSERLGVLLQKRPDILSLRRSDTLSGPDKLLDLAVHPNFVEVPPPKDPTNDVFRVTYPVSAA